MMQFFNLFGQSQEDNSSLEVKQLEVLAASLFAEPQEVEVFPLRNIPVVTEDQLVHDGTWPCGDPDCPCAVYGYGVPSLD